MADNRVYYYMRLKDNFFDTNEMVVLESLQDGYLYSNILLKLYLRSLRDNGKLMFNNTIPYNPQMIATITRHQIGTVERALKIFREMGLIEILDSGAIYMLNIQNYIGQASTEADRKREYRTRIEREKLLDKCPDIPTPEIEIEKDIEIDIETKTKEKNNTPCGAANTAEMNSAEPDFDFEIEMVVNYFLLTYKSVTGKEHEPIIDGRKMVEIKQRLKKYSAVKEYVDEYFYGSVSGGKPLCGYSDMSIFHFSDPGVLDLLGRRVHGTIMVDDA